MTIAYSIIFVLSLLFPPLYWFGTRKKRQEGWLFLLYICVSVVNLGYLLLSLSCTVEFALFANKLAYLGHVFLILCMYKIISKLCGIRHKRWVTALLIGLAVLYVLSAVTNSLLNRLMLECSTVIMRELRTERFSKMQKLPISYFDNNTHGSLMSYFTNDIEATNELLQHSVTQLMISVLSLIFFLSISPVEI